MLRSVVSGLLCAAMAAYAGCGVEDDDADPASYEAYNLFTGAPRFGVFKADAEHDRCTRIVFLWAGGSGTAELGDALTTDAVSVTDRASDCAGVGGGPPSLEPAGVPAQSVSGTVVVEQEGDRWTVSVDGSITFDSAEGWVPEDELVDATAVEIQGGCC